MTKQIEPAAFADRGADRAGRARKRVRKDALPSASRGAQAIARAAAPIAVRWLPVEALKPDKRNARKHSARQVARISAFGFNVPILVDEKGVVLAGHGRLLAAKRLGLKEAPAITLGHLNEAEHRAFMIADNRLSELASWDEGRLGLELEELKSLDLDFTIEATGFEVSEIDLRIEGGRAPGRSQAEPNTTAPLAPAPHIPSRDGHPSGRPMVGAGWGCGSRRLAIRPLEADVWKSMARPLSLALPRKARKGGGNPLPEQHARATRRRSGLIGFAVATPAARRPARRSTPPSGDGRR